MNTVWLDLRSSLRMLRKNPWLNAAIIGTFALGIGATAVIFTIVNSVLLRPLSYPEPQRLFVISEIIPQWAQFAPSLPANLADAQIWQKECHSFEGIAIAEPTSMNTTGNGEAQKLRGVRASANLFEVLGVRTAQGRTFAKDADEPGRGYEIVLTHAFWASHFHADDSVLGKTIELDQDTYTVIGILPALFHFPTSAGPMSQFPDRLDFFQPLNGARSYEQPLIGEFDFAAIARLKRGVEVPTALAELNVIQARIAKLSGQKVDLAAELLPLEETMVGNARRPLYFLLAAVGIVLLIGCINIANLLLARIPGRMREAAIRVALCARRGQLLQQFLTESLVLGILGGVLGTWLAYAGLQSFVAAAPPTIPRLDEVSLDGRVLWFALSLSVFTALVSGGLPAWRMANADPYEMLKAGAIAAGESLQMRRLRQVLVGFEVALCTALLLLAGLLTTSLFRVLRVDTGFAVDRVLAADVELPPRSYSEADARLRFYDQAVDGIRSLPGVLSAAWVSIPPLKGQGSVTGVSLPGAHDEAEIPKADYRVAGPGYFQAMGIPILSGRDFTKDDRNRHVVIVSKSLAKRFWPGENPVGKMCISRWGEAQTNEVIGVAGDIRQVRMEDPPLLMVYVPVMFAQAFPDGPQSASIVVRTQMDSSGAAPEVRQVIHRIDPEVPVVALQPMSALVSQSVSTRSFQMTLALVFAFCALLLAVLGVFGVVAYSVEQRRRDIGIRMAIGAPAKQLRNMVLRQGLAPVLAGLVLGIVAAIVFGRLIAALLFQVGTFDPATTVCVVVIMVSVSLATCWIPARRAMRVDPLVALRCE